MHDCLKKWTYYLIGKIVSKHLINNRVPLKDLHLIGHSLGAHVFGFAGKNIKDATGRMVKRITGLDAAGPLFDILGSEFSLYKTDANVVEGIHTDGGMFGMIRPYGTIDFYVNGGFGPQPGCNVYKPPPKVVNYKYVLQLLIFEIG